MRWLIVPCLMVTALYAQPDRWQQRAYYEMDVTVDVKSHLVQGKQRLVYQNNSPDTLDKVFYHLYFNAFQPNSMMDVRSRNLPDADSRVGSRISALKPNEIGYQKILQLHQNGVPVQYTVVETILEVQLAEPILPHSSTVFDMNFESQVPVQIRRSGRDNAEGIAYSMAQWYPKMCEYDYQGWHANPYIAREFYGIWGDFDVKITIDKEYTIGATGYLQNAQEIGHGYEKPGTVVEKNKGKTLTWHYFAPNVHDFVWSADPEYKHTSKQREDGMVMHFFYQENDRTKDTWAKLPDIMDAAFGIINRTFGQYPYKQYSFLQGGDGGMEYPMATLITGERSLGSLVGVSVHELMHSWFQMMLGTNESLYAWMDEGFTSYASTLVMNELRRMGKLDGTASPNPFAGVYTGFANFAKSGREEPLSTHSDHFNSNAAYGVGSYTKGEIFLHQLEYIIGKKAFDTGMLRYFYTWRFKHPNANDFIRIMEKQSGLELDWYREYWVNTTHTIDYAVTGVEDENGKTVISLKREGKMPMPIDLVITMKDGSKTLYNIPLMIMRGNKPQEFTDKKYVLAADWPWTHPGYKLVLPIEKSQIQQVEIDGSGRLMDVTTDNNIWKNQ